MTHLILTLHRCPSMIKQRFPTTDYLACCPSIRPRRYTMHNFLLQVSLYQFPLLRTSSLNSIRFADPENTLLDQLPWDDSNELAGGGGCQTPEVSLPVLRKSRARRTDEHSSCANPFSTETLQALLSGKFSLSCTLASLGALPIAMHSSGSNSDIVINTNVLNSVNTLGGLRLYYPMTLYRAVIREFKKTSSDLDTFEIRILLLTHRFP